MTSGIRYSWIKSGMGHQANHELFSLRATKLAGKEKKFFLKK
jgi:hypothetical protein